MANQYEEAGWHWRNSMKPVRFFNLDGRAGFFVVVFIIHARLYTLCLLLTVFFVLWLLERRGLSFPAALRSIRVWMVGPYRPGLMRLRRAKMKDTGST
ncbi:MAG: IcmT/TraK family protein [Alphaproteobacteria bacterium]|nr:IcmT/TraK family protein [Alphaproteobacteria bacterium]